MAENDVIEITDRSGSVLMQPESLDTFFASVDNGYTLTDPRTIVDPATGQFIVTVDALTTDFFGNVTGSKVLYAISNTTNPTGGWTFGQVNTTYVINGVTTWSDQPTIASNGTTLVVTSAQFSVSRGQYVANAATTIPLSGGSASAVSLGNAADYRPVAAPGGQYFIGYTGNNSLSLVYNANGSSSYTSSTISLGSIDVGSGTYTAAQKGSSVLLDAGDNSVASTAYANGYIYAVFEVVPPGGTQPAVHWVKVDPSTNTVIAQGNITGPSGAAAFNPSIAVDTNGDVLVNYTVSSSSMDPAAYAAIMPAGSTSFLAPVQYGSSNYPETASFGVTNNVIRWGDYSTAVADPGAANGFVVSNEIVPSAQSNSNNAPWGTVTADIQLSPGGSAAVVTSSSTTTNSTTTGSTTTGSTPSNTATSSVGQLVPLTAASTDNWPGPLSSRVAALDAMNMPAFAPAHGGSLTSPIYPDAVLSTFAANVGFLVASPVAAGGTNSQDPADFGQGQPLSDLTNIAELAKASTSGGSPVGGWQTPPVTAVGVVIGDSDGKGSPGLKDLSKPDVLKG
jgi:hypothetical protein